MIQPWIAVISQAEGWWIGWVAEIASVNSQERMCEALLESLATALQEAIEMYREDAVRHVVNYETVTLDI